MVSPSRVLVVDDDEAIRSMVRAVLRHEGFVVDEACSGNVAIARIRETHYDAVVLDWMMGDGSGQQVLEAAGLEHPRLPFLIMTAVSPARLALIGGSNVCGKLRKPFEITDLVAIVRQCLIADQDHPHVA